MARDGQGYPRRRRDMMMMNDDLYLNKNESIQYGLEIIKIGRLVNGTWSSSVINLGSVFPLVIMASMFGERHTRDMMPNA